MLRVEIVNKGKARGSNVYKYDYRVLVNYRTIASGKVEHNRAKTWRDLLQAVVDSTPTNTEVKRRYD